ncbi:hypothetical protein H6P81_005595 [Aristolochia fimbriata]|uniref:ELMO domain-containing protein n=1 Tax=Aristolochia fimbriata TaxID=158543 RepID=A0AAV7EW00_ARIFI|nr:hypothetical protein H6P81_005595 [Aristolochia fimbriata]
MRERRTERNDRHPVATASASFEFVVSVGWCGMAKEAATDWKSSPLLHWIAWPAPFSSLAAQSFSFFSFLNFLLSKKELISIFKAYSKVEIDLDSAYANVILGFFSGKNSAPDPHLPLAHDVRSTNASPTDNDTANPDNTTLVYHLLTRHLLFLASPLGSSPSAEGVEQMQRISNGTWFHSCDTSAGAMPLRSTSSVSSAMVGSKSWIGGLLNRSSNKRHGVRVIDYCLSPLQEQRLQRLQERLQVPFDEARPDHQESLKALWNAAFPNIDLTGLISEQWKEMGWQGPNPSTDFRGCGFISLENLLFFARTYPASFQRLLCKKEGDRAMWEYPFAVAGINISYMLTQMLDLYSAKPKCLPGQTFIKILSEDEAAFDVLYCIAFEMMDAQWLAMRASYMQFNEVLQATRDQLERELSLEDIHRIQDLPAYNLLYQ